MILFVIEKLNLGLEGILCIKKVRGGVEGKGTLLKFAEAFFAEEIQSAVSYRGCVTLKT